MKKKRNTLDNVPRGLSMFLTLLGSVPYMLLLSSFVISFREFTEFGTIFTTVFTIYIMTKITSWIIYIVVKGYSELLNKRPHRVILLGYYNVRSVVGYIIDLITFVTLIEATKHASTAYFALVIMMMTMISPTIYYKILKKVYKYDLSTIQNTILSYSVKIGVPIALIGVFFRLLKIFVPQIQRVPSDIEVFCILSLMMSLVYLVHALILAIQILYYNNPTLKREMILNIKEEDIN